MSASAVERQAMLELVRAEVRALPRYLPDQGTCDVDVSDNTNLWGSPPAALRALAECAAAGVARYPTLYGEPLVDAVRRHVGLPDAGVVTGCGSDDVIDSAMQAFGAPGERVAFCGPTFTMIPVFARINGLEPVEIPFTADFDVDAERLVDARAKITYLCPPNNPTATAASRAALEYVVERAAGLVIVDEAYAEFARATHADLAMRHDRVLVARTFSKAFGLAGLRVGYGIGAPELIGIVERTRGPYKVTVPAERAAVAALGPGDDAIGWVTRHAALAREMRDRLTTELARLGHPALASDANFVCVPLRDARAVARRMAERGVLVRTVANAPRELGPFAASGGTALRIGVGPWPAMERVLEALTGALAS